MAEFAANVIAESMLSQCDLDGNQYLLLDSIVDYRSDGHAVKANDMYVTVNGRNMLRRQRKDGTCVYSGRMVQQVGKGLLT